MDSKYSLSRILNFRVEYGILFLLCTFAFVLLILHWKYSLLLSYSKLADFNSFFGFFLLFVTLYLIIKSPLATQLIKIKPQIQYYANALIIIIPLIGTIILFSLLGKKPSIFSSLVIKNNPKAIESFIRLEKVIFELNINCQTGNAQIIRKQILIPQIDLETIPEVGYYSSGGLSKENFDIEIWEMNEEGGKTKIDSKVLKFEEPLRRLIQTTLQGKELKRGKKYLRVTKITANGAYLDTLTDGFITIIEYETEVVEINIFFKDVCEYDANTLKIEELLDKGIPNFSDTKTILENTSLTSNKISITIPDPDIGDKYSIFWDYSVHPANVLP